MADTKISQSRTEVIEQWTSQEVFGLRVTNDGFVEAKYLVQNYNTSDGSLDCGYEWVRVDMLRPQHRELKLVK